MISDGLRRKGWSVGWFKFTSTIDGREMWSEEASNPDGRRFVVQAENMSVAFLELEAQCCSRESAAARNRDEPPTAECICPANAPAFTRFSTTNW